MTTRNFHLHKAKHNKEFAEKVIGLGEDYRDWAIVGIFYSALHYVEVLLIDCHFTPSSNHRQRDKRIAEKLKSIRQDYKNLERKGRDARYEDVPLSEKDVTACMRRLSTIEGMANKP